MTETQVKTIEWRQNTPMKAHAEIVRLLDAGWTIAGYTYVEYEYSVLMVYRGGKDITAPGFFMGGVNGEK